MIDTLLLSLAIHWPVYVLLAVFAVVWSQRHRLPLPDDEEFPL